MLSRIRKRLRHPASLLLGSERKQRLRLTRLLMSSLVYLLCLALSAYMVSCGFTSMESSVLLALYIVPGQLVFYLLLRSGLSERRADPSLALPQSIFAVGAILIAYWAVGPARGAVLMLLPLVFVFGMLALRPQQTKTLGILTVVALGTLMFLLVQIAPERFAPRLELVHFVLAAAVLLTLAWVARHIWELRERIRQQRGELSTALQQVEQLAVRDELTGLYNRRHMQLLLGTHLRQMQRTRRAFCVALIDLDHFKQVNDNYGHFVGDEVLRGFASEAERVLRDTDQLGRWGGEEFLVILPDTHAPEAHLALERLRDALTRFYPASTKHSLQVRFSAGIAESRRDEGTEHLIARADAALYGAKAAGRDCSVLSYGKPQTT